MNLVKYFLVALSVLAFTSSNAFAFVSVIDVEEKNGQVITIQNAGDYSFEKLSGLSLSYRGRPEEAIALFQSVAETELPKGLTAYEFEVNEKSETISVIISIQGFLGLDYSYFVIKKSGN